MKMFFRDAQIRNEIQLLKMIEMPAACASRVFVKLTGLPSKIIVPMSGGKTPARMFIIVDLPAPFSPSSAFNRPRRTVMLTPSSALTPGNALELPDRLKQHVGLVRR